MRKGSVKTPFQARNRQIIYMIKMIFDLHTFRLMEKVWRKNSDTSDCIFNRLVLVQNNLECVIRPEVTLCGRLDVKTQLFTHHSVCIGYVPTPLRQLSVKQVKHPPYPTPPPPTYPPLPPPSVHSPPPTPPPHPPPRQKMLQINMGRDGEIYTQYD